MQRERKPLITLSRAAQRTLDGRVLSSPSNKCVSWKGPSVSKGTGTQHLTRYLTSSQEDWSVSIGTQRYSVQVERLQGNVHSGSENEEYTRESREVAEDGNFILNITDAETKGKPMCDMEIGGIPITMYADSGSPFTIVNEEVWNTTFVDKIGKQLLQPDVRQESYTGDNIYLLGFRWLLTKDEEEGSDWLEDELKGLRASREEDSSPSSAQHGSISEREEMINECESSEVCGSSEPDLDVEGAVQVEKRRVTCLGWLKDSVLGHIAVTVADTMDT
ncbi:hypothetical protein NDU88_002243 [Pleurodeles waltl]|uniref:Uncharacterized protein n=1 Tax=Pleurodeles waltl TaxID=8319 RepID=A0AAV7VCA4_PLEWA|nr:hypothetical protein NDU88_002243 [Pleurodeles waltl]